VRPRQQPVHLVVQRLGDVDRQATR
jgi:hypothetical protein